MDKLLHEINDQLGSQGLYIKSAGVTIVDKVNGVARDSALGYASVIEAKQCRPNKDKSGESTQGSDGQSKSTYGFKAHINVDEDGLIKSTDYTLGNVHDSKCCIELLEGDESAVYADSTLACTSHTMWLKAHKAENRISKTSVQKQTPGDARQAV
jgi:IS5 family transposase